MTCFIQKRRGNRTYNLGGIHMTKSKLIPAIVIGAAVGAVISMFDRTTREHTVESAKKVKETVTYYAQNTDELQQLVDTKIGEVQSFISTAEQNINSFTGKANGTTSLPETIVSLISETKDAFSKDNKEA